MFMQLCELKYRASMSVEPIWERRYRAALQYSARDPVNIDWLDHILASEAGGASPAGTVTPEVKVETWRDRAIKSPLL